jgi:tetratricopeptide (TPR) repeat protein
MAPAEKRIASIVVGLGAIIAVTLIAYAPALQGGFIWDDDRYVTHNDLLRTWAGLRTIWLDPSSMLQHYPLTHTSLWLEFQLWGLDARGYHLVNVLLHGTNAGLLWLALRRLAVPAAWLAAAVFALHPVHVESVAWVSELKNIQSGFFYLLAVLAYVRFAFGRDESSPRRLYALALLSFLCAVLSKTVACSLPVALLLCVWWKKGELTRQDVAPLIPFFVLGLLLGLPTAWMERNYVGAQGEEWDLSLVARCLVAGRALWFYAGKLGWPANLTFIYPRWDIDTTALWQYLFPVAAAAVVAMLWARRALLGRGPLAAVLYFAATLGPALGFFNVYPMRYSFVADHFQYLASIGLIVLVVASLAAAARRRGVRPVFYVASAALLLALGATAWRQSHAYRDLETLWRDTVRKNPAAWMAHNNLGRELLSQGKVGEAAQSFQAALALKPDYMDALYNMGNVSASLGQLDAARDYYEQALRIYPHFAPAHNNLANIHVYQGRMAEAIEHYERALELMPDYPRARDNLNAARSMEKSGATRQAAP